MIIVNVHNFNCSTNDWDPSLSNLASRVVPRHSTPLEGHARFKRRAVSTRAPAIDSRCPMCYLAFPPWLSRPHLTPGVSGLHPTVKLNLVHLSVRSLVHCRTKYHCKLLNLFSLQQSPTTPVKGSGSLESLSATPEDLQSYSTYAESHTLGAKGVKPRGQIEIFF